MRKIIVILCILACMASFLGAQNSRLMPLDIYLIIDNSAAFRQSGNDAIEWLITSFINPGLLEGDSIHVWAAGDRAENIFSGTMSTQINAGDFQEKVSLRNSILALEAGSRSADFSGALASASSRQRENQANQIGQSSLPVTLLVTSSASGLEPLLSGDSQHLLRWSRTLYYEGWQILVVAPNLGPAVQEAARTYMNSRR